MPKITFLDSPDDVQWLKDTALKGVILPSKYTGFQSFTLHGNEDSPDSVDLYVSNSPKCNDNYLRIVFVNNPPIYCEYSEINSVTGKPL